METFVLKPKNLTYSICMLHMSRVFVNSGSRDTFQFLMKWAIIFYVFTLNCYISHYFFFLPGEMPLQGTETYQTAEEFDVFNIFPESPDLRSFH